MSKKLRFVLIVLVMAAMVFFYFRYQLVFRWQQYLLSSISTAATVDNQQFAAKDSVHQQHLIYQLKGTERLIPHRVNSIQRLQFLYPHFKGFECDIRFNTATKFLYIGHDEKDISDLTLPDFLMADADKKCFWLDVKNIDSNNVQPFLLALAQLDTVYQLKQRVIIESSDLSAIKTIAAQGYLTSYYVPVYGEKTMSELATAAIGYDGLVSQEYALLPQLKEKFPNHPIATWEIGFTLSHSGKQLADFANNKHILCCMINVKSPNYR